MGSMLIIGGSVFLGRAIAAEAMSRGHAVSTVNRGQSGTDPPGVEALRANRDDEAGLARAVAGRRWDTVVDTCGIVPRTVGAGAGLLTAHARHYIFVSSVNAMRTWPADVVDEDSPVWDCAADADESAGPYGVLKAGCERAVRENFGGRTTSVRPGVIVGPHENIGRLPWWLRRMRRSSPALVPRDDGAIQLIDARDLAAFITDRHDDPRAEVYLTAGQEKATLREMIDRCAAAAGSMAEQRAAGDDFLLAHGVDPWWELPMWAPRQSSWASACSVSGIRAANDGLTSRPLAQTIGDTWHWLRQNPEFRGRPKIGISPEKEARILADLPSELPGAGGDEREPRRRIWHSRKADTDF